MNEAHAADIGSVSAPARDETVPHPRSESWVRPLDWAWAVVLGIFTQCYQYATFDGFLNDHFVTIARAFQVAQGAWPVRDFFDPGMPLAYLLPAAAMAVGGDTLVPQLVLETLFFSVAVGITFLLARRASGSAVLALALVAVVLAAAPRLYNTSKVLVQVVALAIGWWYANRPTGARAVALGAWTGIAFLVRHDYAVYIGVASAVLLTVVHYPSFRVPTRRVAVYALAAAAFVAPWLVYVQWAGGLVEYFASAARFSAAEAGRTTRLNLALPLMSLLPLAVLWLGKRGTRRLGPAHLAFAGTLMVFVDAAFLRGSVDARVPDVVAPSAVLAAALLGALPRPAVSLAAAPALVTAFVAAPEQLLSFRPTPGNVLALTNRVSVDVERWRVEMFPRGQLPPVVEYIRRCTGPSERVMVIGFAPQLPVLARRPFAGGTPAWLSGYYEHQSDVAVAEAWLAREPIGIVAMVDGPDVLAERWPRIATLLTGRGFALHQLPIEEGTLPIWLPPRPGAPTDAETGLPCAR